MTPTYARGPDLRSPGHHRTTNNIATGAANDIAPGDGTRRRPTEQDWLDAFARVAENVRRWDR